ncbi:related to SAD1-protein required for assembly of U4 snRNA into the U4/U6 particle [Sporisorium reilianum f. sp. reilianum]|uniref:Related to SAD1-protein required for assembly of U4 snRNA into the U4/U6 particle n=1 Tax=Sporisorium reilianum f. sp. reilianum TaxID=72559 RepID=A0A2N8U7S6_9BASI|nr:related to SAD1-protein required for assembly of U4 snRNA into the U4/U6 particle [Sporisorium reilianum f. sp. reilianum]
MTNLSTSPTKRQRTAQDGRKPSPPPPPPPQDDAPAPIESLPGPPDSPPPPPPLDATLDEAQNSDIVPPPPPSVPPPPPPEQANEDDDDDADVQDAAYWTRRAQSSSSSSAHTVPSLSSKTSNGTVAAKKGKSALYLDTINRAVLDFDFEKLCSISLSNINVYACLVCGRYFQGRGRNSYAYLHSIDNSHHVFMNLSTAQTYILPDNYAVPEENQAALQDVKYLLNPTFTRKTIEAIDAGPAYDLNGEQYYPGFVGLNNVGKNDYVNAVVQALVHVPAIRDYFLLEHEREGEAEKSELVKRFGALVRKMWNPRAFKAQVSPHEFLQQVAMVSGNRFKITHQSDPVEFLGWLLNRLHADLAGGKGGKRKRGAGAAGESVISKSFQGVVQVESQPLAARSEEAEPSTSAVAAQAGTLLKTQQSNGQTDEQGRMRFDPALSVDKRDSPFLLLAMDLPPPPPVLGGEEGEHLVPQVTLGQVLAKYDGDSLHASNAKLTRYALRRLPPYLIVHFRRFTKNSLGQEERNPTLVNFPIKGLDVAKHVPLLNNAQASTQDANLSEVYDLVANVVYDAVPGTVRQGASWKCQVHTNAPTAKEGEKWFAIQDLLVEQVNRQMIFLGESYLQIWAKRP